MAKIQPFINLFTRTFGGTQEPAVADKYISGYGFIWFEKLPAFLDNESYKALAALCRGVTLPTIDLNKSTDEGIGGAAKWSDPTNLTIGDTISIRYIELSGTPITKIHTKWVQYIRDSRTGATNMTDYTKSKYSASLFYWTTRPDGETIEQAYYMTGVFPQRLPIDSHNFDVTTVDKVEIEITYNVDNIYIYDEDELVGNSFIANKIQNYINEITAYRDYIQTFSV